MVKILVKCSECFSELWAKVKLSLLPFPTTHAAEQGFSEVLHARKKYCNRLGAIKTGVISIRHKLTNL